MTLEFNLVDDKWIKLIGHEPVSLLQFFDMQEAPSWQARLSRSCSSSGCCWRLLSAHVLWMMRMTMRSCQWMI